MLKINGHEVHAVAPEFLGDRIVGYYAVCLAVEQRVTRVVWLSGAEVGDWSYQVGGDIVAEAGPLGLERAVGEAVKRMYVRAGLPHMPWDEIVAEVERPGA